jgi:hypothetical protein
VRGPLPKKNPRRRNAPSIPTTALPAGGWTDPPPKLPPNHGLRKAGRAWWNWAWKTPQAAAWALGHESVVARRASLEDDLATLELVQGLDFDEFVDRTAAAAVRTAVNRVAALATGRLQIVREMRELDDRLGLTPKAMAQLRWSIKADDADVSEVPAGDNNVVTPERWQRSAG